ncbi:MAG: choice-of-anchor D domain-containing protein, partial [Terriglobales bacterium]
SATQTVTVSNTSTTTPLTITSIVKAGANAADFSLGGTCPAAGGQVPALGSCTVTSAFTPSARLGRAATITLTDDAGNVAGSTQVINLNGTGIAPIASLSTNTMAFGNQRINTTSATQTVTLTNTGDDTLNITSIIKAGANAADFSLGGTCPVGASVLAPLASCTITSAFTPSALLARAATITATDDSNAVAGSTQVINLTGTGTAPVASLSANTMAFGNQNVGTTTTGRLISGKMSTSMCWKDTIPRSTTIRLIATTA